MPLLSPFSLNPPLYENKKRPLYEVSNIETCHKRKGGKQTNKIEQKTNYYTTVYTVKSKGDNNIFDTVHIFSFTAKLLLRL